MEDSSMQDTEICGERHHDDEPLQLDVKTSDELSAAFYAAAAAVSRFNKQCALEEKRQLAAGSRKMLEATADPPSAIRRVVLWQRVPSYLFCIDSCKA